MRYAINIRPFVCLGLLLAFAAAGCTPTEPHHARSSVEPDFSRGMQEYLNGDYRRAAWTFERLSSTSSSRTSTIDAGLFLGRCHLNMGRYGEAEAVFRRVMRSGRHPQIRAEAHAGLAEALTRQGRHSEAATQWRALLEHSEYNYYIAADKALYRLAECARAMGDEPLANHLMRQLATSFAGSPSPYLDAAHRAAPPATQAAPPVAGRYFVQVAAVRSEANARATSQALRTKGYPVSMTIGPDGLTQIRVGPFASRADAIERMTRLRNDGYASAFVVSGGF